MTDPLIQRTKVFVSYSHQDKEWLKRLRIHLKPLERRYGIDVWVDTDIKPGSKWRDEIERALAAAKVAVLLISADFIASDFIEKSELPPLLRAAEAEGTIILPLIISPSMYSRIAELAQFQAVNDPSRPLVELSKGQQEEVLVRLTEAIQHVLGHFPDGESGSGRELPNNQRRKADGLRQWPRKKSKAPLIIAGVLLFLFLSGGALAGVFFFVVKPIMDERAALRERTENPPSVVHSTAEVAPTIEQLSPTPEDTFGPPPGMVEFQNSGANLDGRLAEHYFDFSFYYPQGWQLDPKAGVPGAGNFVKVERRLSPASIQENFAVGWYASTGTFAGDLRNFRQRVEDVSAVLAKAYPEYRKVSEGPTKVNSLDAYELRWEGLSRGTDSDIHLWGRVVFLPTGKEGDTNGAIMMMLSTSLAPELSSVDDIGEKGEVKVILESFRFGKKQ